MKHNSDTKDFIRNFFPGYSFEDNLEAFIVHKESEERLLTVILNGKHLSVYWNLDDVNDKKEMFDKIEKIVLKFLKKRIKLYDLDGVNGLVCLMKGKKASWYKYDYRLLVGFEPEGTFYLNEIDINTLKSDKRNEINMNPPPGFAVKKSEW